MVQSISNPSVLLWLPIAVVLTAVPEAAGSDALDGAWELEAYELQGKDVSVSGLMIFAGGHFATVYTMPEGSLKSGRGHGGRYRVEGDVVSFEVPWWVEYVSGTPRVLERAAAAKGRIQQEGDKLAIHFESGSVQKFRRIPPGNEKVLTGAWLMESYESPAKTGPADGLMLFKDGRFALVYTMRPTGDVLDGRGHAGQYSVEGNAVTLVVPWSLQYVSGEASVADETSRRVMRHMVNGDRLTLTFESGAVQAFRSAGGRMSR